MPTIPFEPKVIRWLTSESAEVLRGGSWLYDGTVIGHVRILKVKGAEPNILYSDDEDTVHPPTDANGFYYVAEFWLPSTGNSMGSSSWGHATVEEAIRYAEEKLPNPVNWDLNP